MYSIESRSIGSLTKTKALASTNIEDKSGDFLDKDIIFKNHVEKIVKLSNTHIKANWDEFEHRYGDGLFALNRLIGFISYFHTEKDLDDVISFFKNHRAPGAERAIKQAIEVIHLNIRWLSHNRDELDSWLHSQRQL